MGRKAKEDAKGLVVKLVFDSGFSKKDKIEMSFVKKGKPQKLVLSSGWLSFPAQEKWGIKTSIKGVDQHVSEKLNAWKTELVPAIERLFRAQNIYSVDLHRASKSFASVPRKKKKKKAK